MTSPADSPSPALTSPAWGAAIARHHHRVHLSLIAMGIPFARAAELTQEVWLKLYTQHQGGAIERLELPGLALTQARFLGLEELRRVRTAPETDAQDAPEVATVLRLDDQLAHRQQLKTVLAALAEESPVNQRVFELLYRDPGRPHAEIALEVGLSLQRVRQILYEVRGRLRAAVERT